MNDKLIIIVNPDKSIDIITPSPKFYEKAKNIIKKQQPDIEEVELQHFILTNIAGEINNSNGQIKIIDKSSFPNNRLFRSAWRLDNTSNTIKIDMIEARNVKKLELKAIVDKKIENLKTHLGTLKLLNDQPTQSNISDRIQELMQIVEDIDLSNIEDPEQLSSYIPPEISNL